jgi:hypothetical protein
VAISFYHFELWERGRHQGLILKARVFLLHALLAYIVMPHKKTRDDIGACLQINGLAPISCSIYGSRARPNRLPGRTCTQHRVHGVTHDLQGHYRPCPPPTSSGRLYACRPRHATLPCLRHQQAT